jgi:hypothetical protein
MEVTTLEIFGKYIFGSCAVQWLKLCKEQKREWILKYTEQTDESLISEFVNNPKISKDCHCLDCGKNKNKDGISAGVSEKVATVTKSIQNRGNGKSNSNKRQSRTEKGKDKRV